MRCGRWSRYWRQKTRSTNTCDENFFWRQNTLAANTLGNKQRWRQTVLTTNNSVDKQYWWQTILTTNNSVDRQFWRQTITTFLLDSSSKCLLSFISLFNNGETVFICFGNAFTVNRFFSQAYVQRHPFQREDYKCSLHGLCFGFSRTSVIKNKAKGDDPPLPFEIVQRTLSFVVGDQIYKMRLFLS